MRALLPIMLFLGYALSGCSSSQSAEALLRNLPVAPHATAPRQSGSMLQYDTPGACLEVSAFYHTQMLTSGWMDSTSDAAGSSWVVLEFAKDRDSVQVHLTETPMGEPKCSIQVFYHKYSPLDTFVPQRVAVIIIILVIQALFAYYCGIASKGKGRRPAIGWLIGFFLGFMGALFILTWEPRRDRSGRMIGWDEYKLLSKEQREAIRPIPTPLSPEMKRRRLLVVILAVILIVAFVFQILRNLGRL